jgi:hypothetical protein
VRIWSTARNIFEWAPILSLPFVVFVLTDEFTEPLSRDLIGSLVGLTVLNLAWIGFSRVVRAQDNFKKKYPGYSWNKLNG